MKNYILFFAVLLAAVGILNGCSSRNKLTVTNLSPVQLNAMLKNKNFTLINVHVPYEGELAGTDLFIPYNTIGDNLTLLPARQDKMVLYCRSGSMSTIAAETLTGLGYTQIYNLTGGMYSWEAAGYPLLYKTGPE